MRSLSNKNLKQILPRATSYSMAKPKVGCKSIKIRTNQPIRVGQEGGMSRNKINLFEADRKEESRGFMRRKQ